MSTKRVTVTLLMIFLCCTACTNTRQQKIEDQITNEKLVRYGQTLNKRNQIHDSRIEIANESDKIRQRISSLQDDIASSNNKLSELREVSAKLEAEIRLYENELERYTNQTNQNQSIPTYQEIRCSEVVQSDSSKITNTLLAIAGEILIPSPIMAAINIFRLPALIKNIAKAIDLVITARNTIKIINDNYSNPSQTC